MANFSCSACIKALEMCNLTQCGDQLCGSSVARQLPWVSGCSRLSLELMFPVQVRAVEDAKDRLKKEQRFKARNSKSVSQATNSEKEIIRAQMEADRQERLATQQPVTQASTAQQLNGRAQIRSAGDLGLNAG